jgi:hypothetical protein
MNQAFQNMLKEVFDNSVPGLVEKLGFFINHKFSSFEI